MTRVKSDIRTGERDVPDNRDGGVSWRRYSQTELPFVPGASELQSFERSYKYGQQKIAESFGAISPELWGRFLVVSDSILWAKLPDGWRESQERFESYARFDA